MPGVKPRFVGCADRSVVTVLTELPTHWRKVVGSKTVALCLQTFLNLQNFKLHNFEKVEQSSLCSFGNFPGVRSIKADVSELNVGFLIAQDDGTDIEFRNVGFYTSDAGEIPKRTQTTNHATNFQRN